jgi:TRAP-type mannitol/chloroaromatic compound transport system permease small subunit
MGESMPKISSLLKKVDWISEASGKVVSYLGLILAFAVTLEVGARYIFNSPTKWGYETAIFAFGSYVILGGAYTLRHDAHVRVDVFYGFRSPRGKAILDIITFWLFLAFAGILVVKGWEFGWTSLRNFEHTDTAWSPPVYYFKMTLFIGAVLLLLQGIARFIRDLYLVFTGKELP